MSITQNAAAVLVLIVAAVLAAPDKADQLSSPHFELKDAVDFRHSASPSDLKHLPETMGSGVAVLDIDGDGRMDLFFVNGATPSPSGGQPAPARNRLYRNLGNWRFENVTDAWAVGGVRFGMGVAVGDYDNDGRSDLYVTALDRNYLYKNTGSKFVDATETAGVAGFGWSAGAAFIDFDRDGWLDLFFARYLDWNFENSRWCGEGDGVPRSYCHPREFRKVTHTLLRNLGNGSFEDISRSAGIGAKPGKGLGVKIDDVNGDGWPDILVANDSVAQQLFLNRSGARFVETALKSGLAYDDNGNAYAGMGIDAADLDGDGLPEVAINALARQGYWLYKNAGEGRFSDASASSGLSRITDMRSGWGMRLADFDNDGWPDLVVAQGHVMDTIEWSDPAVRYLEPPLLAKNVFGKFFDVSAQAGPAFSALRAGRGLAAGDLDGDGRLDLVINNNNSSPTLLRNVTKSENNWLALRLEGSRSNRDGYGSEVIVTTDSDRRFRAYADTSGSYLSASSSVLHFGLGPAGKARQIEVRWPRGARSVWRGLVSNQSMRLREPANDVNVGGR